MLNKKTFMELVIFLRLPRILIVQLNNDIKPTFNKTKFKFLVGKTLVT